MEQIETLKGPCYRATRLYMRSFDHGSRNRLPVFLVYAEDMDPVDEELDNMIWQV